MIELDLRPGEKIIEEIRADYWENLLFMLSQKRGRFVFTNQRVHIRAGLVTIIDLEYKDMIGVKKCNVGGMIRIIPTGILVKMRDGKKHYLSVLKRNKYIELLEQNVTN